MAQVFAPMAGKVIKILVSEGAQVKEDDEVLILEAMKMEMPVVCPCGGTVKRIEVKEGQAVEAEQSVLVID